MKLYFIWKFFCIFSISLSVMKKNYPEIDCVGRSWSDILKDLQNECDGMYMCVDILCKNYVIMYVFFLIIIFMIIKLIIFRFWTNHSEMWFFWRNSEGPDLSAEKSKKLQDPDDIVLASAKFLGIEEGSKGSCRTPTLIEDWVIMCLLCSSCKFSRRDCETSARKPHCSSWNDCEYIYFLNLFIKNISFI